MRCEGCHRDLSELSAICVHCGKTVDSSRRSPCAAAAEPRSAALSGHVDPVPDGSAAGPDASGQAPRRDVASDPHFNPGAAHVIVLLEAVRSSPFVRANSIYFETCGRISAYLDSGEDSFNASAIDHPEARLSDGGSVRCPAVVLNVGLIRWSRLISAFLCGEFHQASARGIRDVTASRLRMVGSVIAGDRPGDAEAMLAISVAKLNEPSVRAGASELALGIELSVMAHEVGHVCLGHTSSGVRPGDISRNQEREADSFAASVLSSLPGGETTVLGYVLCPLLFAWVDHACRRKIPGSHPLGRERLESALRNRSEHIERVKRVYGVGAPELMALLPAIA